MGEGAREAYLEELEEACCSPGRGAGRVGERGVGGEGEAEARAEAERRTRRTRRAGRVG